jgi:Tfp pilus assembly protein PilN
MSRSWNFARRPFQDDRPIWVVTAVLLLAGLVLLAANVRQVADYRRGVADIQASIDALQSRQQKAEASAQAAKSALSSYRVSAMAEESRGLARLVEERRFSWTTLLARLERTLPPLVGVIHLQPRFETGGEIWLEMQLVAKNQDAAVATIAALSKDPAFTHVELRSEITAEAGSPDPFQFAVSSRYEPLKGARR